MKRGFLTPFCSLILAVAPILAVAGCGDSPTGGDVSLAKAGGVVTFKGGPLAGASVTFIPEKGPVASGVTDLEGKFSLSTGTMPGAAIGPCNVTVSAALPGDTAKSSNPLADAMKPPTTDEERKQRMNAINTVGQMQRKMNETGAKVPEGQSAPKSAIPERYAMPDSSKLTATVEKDPSKNNFTFALTE